MAPEGRPLSRRWLTLGPQWPTASPADLGKRAGEQVAGVGQDAVVQEQAAQPCVPGRVEDCLVGQFPESSLAADVARLRQVLDRQDGPTIVAGHSYGGQIMTALGTDAPNIAGLVYIAAFGLDEGESIGGLLTQGGPPTPALAHLDIDKQGFASIFPEDDFVHHFAADVDPVKAQVMYAVQQALSASTFQDVRGVPGLEITSVLVPGRRERSGHPARRRAPVRQAHECHHHRGPVRPRGDGLPPRRGSGPHRDRSPISPGRKLASGSHLAAVLS